MASKPTNPRIDTLVKPLLDDFLADAAREATVISEAAVKTFISQGAALPTKADFVGQLFVLVGAQSGNGLYVSTGTTTPGWKTVSHAS